jgi:hypothetical protein
MRRRWIIGNGIIYTIWIKVTFRYEKRLVSHQAFTEMSDYEGLSKEEWKAAPSL